MTSKKLSAILHTLAFLLTNAAIVAFVPNQFRELATLVGNFVVGVSAFYDKTHAIASGLK